MNKEELGLGVFVYKNVIDNHESLIQKIEDFVKLGAVSWQDASIGSANSKSYVEKNVRDTSIILVPYTENPPEDLSSSLRAFNSILGGIFFKSFDPIEKDYISSHGIDLFWHDSYHILKYDISQKFSNHVDDSPRYPRRVSTAYYLNDNYGGGEIIFPRLGLNYKPSANEMLVFPSNYIYNHSVAPVTSGTRYSIVSWLR